jgi:1-aminocyclopropane-1-carboxylate deaminase/D-cysteine desulfhydrase-like pyridoxal-dependent ACC family enzyme
LSYLDATVELYEQSQTEGKQFEQLFIIGGTGTSETGVIFAAALLGKPFHVNIISVEDGEPSLRKSIEQLIPRVETLIGVKMPYQPDEVMTISDEYRGEGWGIDTEESLAAIYELAQTEAIFLDKAFNAKCVAGMKDLLKSGRVACNSACYINTGGFPSLFSQFDF